MLDLSFGEILLLATVVIIFIGPKDMPAALRGIARALAGVKALAREFREAVEDLAQESGVKDVQKEIEREMRLITGDDGKKYEAYDIADFLPPPPTEQPTQPPRDAQP